MRRLFALCIALLLALIPMQTGLCSTSISLKEMMQRYEDVFFGGNGYIQCNPSSNREAIFQKEITEWYEYQFEIPLRYEEFCVTDLDADGYPEIILRLSDSFGFDLFRYDNGQVYGFPFGYRAMEDITLNGDIHGSNGADDYGWYKVRFHEDKQEMIDTCWMEPDEDYHLHYYVGGKEVSENEFKDICTDIEGRKRPTWFEFTPENFSTVVSKF